MRLGQCTMGVLVGRVSKMRDSTYERVMDIGHIVGLDMNCTGEVVVKVQWASDGNVRSIHPGNLAPIGDDVTGAYKEQADQRYVYSNPLVLKKS